MNGRADEPTELVDPPEAEGWPVTELYRVAPEEPEASEAPTVVGSAPTMTEPAGEPRAHRRLPPTGAGLGVAIILVTLGIALGAWLLTRDDTGADTTGTTTATTVTTPASSPPAQPAGPARAEVADVVGLRVSNARVVLEQAGFEVRVTRRSSDRPPGEVLGQSPVAGRLLQARETVTLVVSRQARPVVVRVDVPDVVSLPVAVATAALRRAGLRPQVELVPSGKEAGSVLEQRPGAGDEVAEGTLVALSVARSRTPAVARVEVPDVVGTPVGEARQTLRALGLRVSVVRVRADAPAGTVIGQTPPASSTVREGASVRLRVSTGARSTTVPDVLGLDESTARAELEAAGFVVRVSEEPTADPVDDGVVLRQTPAGGASSDEGAVVTLVIGRYD